MPANVWLEASSPIALSLSSLTSAMPPLGFSFELPALRPPNSLDKQPDWSPDTSTISKRLQLRLCLFSQLQRALAVQTHVHVHVCLCVCMCLCARALLEQLDDIRQPLVHRMEPMGLESQHVAAQLA
eukprot:2208055-Amphidinium_carterae.1